MTESQGRVFRGKNLVCVARRSPLPIVNFFTMGSRDGIM